MAGHDAGMRGCSGRRVGQSVAETPTNHPERIKEKRPVRLACLRHTASVHPEPGSNSPKQVFQMEHNLVIQPAVNEKLTAGIHYE